MSDLPELSETTKRKFELEWNAVLENCFNGDHLHWHDRERVRLRKISAERRIFGRDGLGRVNEQFVDEKGIFQSVGLAERRLYDFALAYWPFWSVDTGCEVFADWLNLLKGRVLDEVASIWMGHSEALDRWYERACKPALETALAPKVKEFKGWARKAELEALDRAISTELMERYRRPEVGEGMAAEDPELANLGREPALREVIESASEATHESSTEKRKQERAERLTSAQNRWSQHEKSGTPFKRIHEAAKVDHKDAYDWKNGKLSDESAMSKKIESVLKNEAPPRQPLT
jgi:hypothetical protein